jgi:hypothetical protein
MTDVQETTTALAPARSDEQRVADVIARMVSGQSREVIAAEMGMTPAAVDTDVVTALNAEVTYRQSGSSYLEELQFRRYEELLSVWMPVAKKLNVGDKRRLRLEKRLPDASEPTFQQAATAMDKCLRALRDINQLKRLGTFASDDVGGDIVNPTMIFQQFNAPATVHNGGVVVEDEEDVIEITR